MDDLERLIAAFRAYSGPWATAWKLDALLDLGKLRDPRVVAFLVTLLAARDEPAEIRLDALNRLRGFELDPDERALVASRLVDLLEDDVDARLRLHAVLALGDFAEVPCVIEPLGAVALSQSESFDLRYAAFASIERAGPTPEVIALLSKLTTDELLGRSAASMLKSWRYN